MSVLVWTVGMGKDLIKKFCVFGLLFAHIFKIFPDIFKGALDWVLEFCKDGRGIFWTYHVLMNRHMLKEID